jgi:hypothetical protein
MWDDNENNSQRPNGRLSVFFSGFPENWRSGQDPSKQHYLGETRRSNSKIQFRDFRCFRPFRCFLFFPVSGAAKHDSAPAPRHEESLARQSFFPTR